MNVTIDAEKLRMIMFQKRETVKSLSEKLGRSRNVVSTILKKGSCSERNAWKIADVLEISAETFSKLKI